MPEPISAVACRDLLLPGVYMINKDYPGIRFEMVISYETQDILVKGYNPKNKRSLGFAITVQERLDNSYKVKFAPSLNALGRALMAEDARDPGIEAAVDALRTPT